MDDLVSEFITETTESLSLLDSELVKLERNPGDEATLGNIFRIVHTIKGTCGFLGLARLEALAHAGENVLGKIRDKELSASPQAISLVLKALDGIKALVEHLSEHGSEQEGDDAGLIGDLNRFAEGKAPAEAPGEAADEAPPAVIQEEAPAEDFSSFFKGDDELEALIAAQTAKAEPPAKPPEPPAAAAPEPVKKPSAPVAPAKKEEAAKENAAGGGAQTIRVNIEVLEHLMQTVSELVLARNQLLQVARTKGDRDFLTPLQHLSHVTTELQEDVMKTRMQPISNAWSKFPRLVRDLSMELGKSIELEMVGAETELDRQLLELIKDPLTHMVRNSCDHGLEMPADRLAAGKNETGTVTLSAYHEGGQIIIEIADDGRGLNLDRIKQKALANGVATQAEIDAMSDQQIMQFIFAAGFSTAEKVTAVSGRGVGMDVVRTNIEKMGGTIELHSEMGKGSTFYIKIPLTLAIVSVLIVETCGEKFAVPQINVLELVRVAPGKEYSIETIDGAAVLRLRDQLLPLKALDEILCLRREPVDWTQQSAFVAVCKAGNYDFGIIVDRVHDIEEIVVKPVGELLRDIPLYAGNTILGDGSVIMILDPGSLAREINGTQFADQRAADTLRKEDSCGNKIGFLLTSTGKGAPKAVPLEMVLRLEEINVKSIESAGDNSVVQYRGGLMRLALLDPSMKLPDEGMLQVIVFHCDKKTVGLVVESIIDITRAVFEVQIPSEDQAYLGSMIIDGKTVDVVDVSQLIGKLVGMVDISRIDQQKAKESHLLLVEDSPFFRNITQPFLAAVGYRVTTADDGAKALQILKEHPSRFQMVVTDIEMPVMNGFEFAKACKAAPELSRIPLIAYTSKVSAEVEKKCKDIGIDECIVKTDREGLLESVSRLGGSFREVV